MSSWGALVVGVVLLAFNAFFVGAEFALISARRTQLEPLAAGGSWAARITLRAMERVSLVMAGAQLGITMASLGLGAIAEPALAHVLEPLFHAVHVPDSLLHPASFVLALTIVVYLHVVLGEMVPKNIALAGPDRAALVLGPPMYGIVAVLKPLVAGLNHLANGILRLVRVQPKDEVASVFTREEVSALVDESRHEGLLPESEYARLHNVLGFTERDVSSVLMPVSSLATVPRGAPLEAVERVCATTGYSRFPVTSTDGDLIGYLHIKDVLETDPDRQNRIVDPKWIRPFATVSVDEPLHEALEVLQRRGAHMARVVDAEGNVLGLVTLEDVLEELVGEIRDAAHGATAG